MEELEDDIVQKLIKKKLRKEKRKTDGDIDKDLVQSKKNAHIDKINSILKKGKSELLTKTINQTEKIDPIFKKNQKNKLLSKSRNNYLKK